MKCQRQKKFKVMLERSGPEWSGRGGYVRVRNVRFTKARDRKASAWKVRGRNGEG
jgi:hypothetical protein